MPPPRHISRLHQCEPRKQRDHRPVNELECGTACEAGHG
ncbi:hypothetical protein R2A130_0981 [Ahrensia sp. R2A130]|nr:hypothetical protein R2A130_0981 [Ahrensia sp. R2A130]